jgi:hypothetical protein
LTRYDELGVLFDDATIIAARLGPLKPKDHIPSNRANPSKDESIVVPQVANRVVNMDGVDSPDLDESRSDHSRKGDSAHRWADSACLRRGY